MSIAFLQAQIPFPNNLSPSLLSVTWNTILSVSISFSVISDSCYCSFHLSLAAHLSIPFVPTWWGQNWSCSNTMLILGLQCVLNILKMSSILHSNCCTVSFDRLQMLPHPQQNSQKPDLGFSSILLHHLGEITVFLSPILCCQAVTADDCPSQAKMHHLIFNVVFCLMHSLPLSSF